MSIAVIIVVVTGIAFLGMAACVNLVPARYANALRTTWNSLVTWQWTKKLLHWLIISAGTMSELAFLVASIWMSINASVHPFVLLFISQRLSEHISELATTAYVALPELILALAVVTTLGHVRLWLYDKNNYTAMIWAGLYGLPTLVFLVLSLVTVGSSVASITFQVPELLIVIRALAGYMFAFSSLLYTQLGKPQEKDRLAKKDQLLLELREEKDRIIENLNAQNIRLKGELEKLEESLEARKNTETELLKALNKSSETSLEAYSQDCRDWLMSGLKTVSIDAITGFSGHSKRKITNAIASGNLQVSPRNKELILISSLVEWLKNNLPAKDTEPKLHIVNQ